MNPSYPSNQHAQWSQQPQWPQPPQPQQYQPQGYQPQGYQQVQQQGQQQAYAQQQPAHQQSQQTAFPQPQQLPPQSFPAVPSYTPSTSSDPFDTFVGQPTRYGESVATPSPYGSSASIDSYLPQPRPVKSTSTASYSAFDDVRVQNRPTSAYPPQTSSQYPPQQSQPYGAEGYPSTYPTQNQSSPYPSQGPSAVSQAQYSTSSTHGNSAPWQQQHQQHQQQSYGNNPSQQYGSANSRPFDVTGYPQQQFTPGQPQQTQPHQQQQQQSGPLYSSPAQRQDTPSVNAGNPSAWASPSMFRGSGGAPDVNTQLEKLSSLMNAMGAQGPNDSFGLTHQSQPPLMSFSDNPSTEPPNRQHATYSQQPSSEYHQQNVSIGQQPHQQMGSGFQQGTPKPHDQEYQQRQTSQQWNSQSLAYSQAAPPQAQAVTNAEVQAQAIVVQTQPQLQTPPHRQPDEQQFQPQSIPQFQSQRTQTDGGQAAQGTGRDWLTPLQQLESDGATGHMTQSYGQHSSQPAPIASVSQVQQESCYSGDSASSSALSSSSYAVSEQTSSVLASATDSTEEEEGYMWQQQGTPGDWKLLYFILDKRKVLLAFETCPSAGSNARPCQVWQLDHGLEVIEDFPAFKAPVTRCFAVQAKPMSSSYVIFGTDEENSRNQWIESIRRLTKGEEIVQAWAPWKSNEQELLLKKKEQEKKVLELEEKTSLQREEELQEAMKKATAEVDQRLLEEHGAAAVDALKLSIDLSQGQETSIVAAPEETENQSLIETTPTISQPEPTTVDAYDSASELSAAPMTNPSLMVPVEAVQSEPSAVVEAKGDLKHTASALTAEAEQSINSEATAAAIQAATLAAQADAKAELERERAEAQAALQAQQNELQAWKEQREQMLREEQEKIRKELEEKYRKEMEEAKKAQEEKWASEKKALKAKLKDDQRKQVLQWLEDNPSWKQYYLSLGVTEEEMQDINVVKKMIQDTAKYMLTNASNTAATTHSPSPQQVKTPNTDVEPSLPPVAPVSAPPPPPPPPMAPSGGPPPRPSVPAPAYQRPIPTDSTPTGSVPQVSHSASLADAIKNPGLKKVDHAAVQAARPAAAPSLLDEIANFKFDSNRKHTVPMPTDLDERDQDSLRAILAKQLTMFRSKLGESGSGDVGEGEVEDDDWE